MNAFIKYVLIGLVVVFVASCDNNDPIIDSRPLLEIALGIENESGDDLLNPSTSGNILDEECEFYYYGKKLLIDPTLICDYTKNEVNVQRGEGFNVEVEAGGYYSDKHYIHILFSPGVNIDDSLYDMRLRIGAKVYTLEYSGGVMYVDGTFAGYSRDCVKLVY